MVRRILQLPLGLLLRPVLELRVLRSLLRALLLRLTLLLALSSSVMIKTARASVQSPSDPWTAVAAAVCSGVEDRTTPGVVAVVGRAGLNHREPLSFIQPVEQCINEHSRSTSKYELIKNCSGHKHMLHSEYQSRSSILFSHACGNFTNDGRLPPLNDGANPAVSVSNTLWDVASLTKVVATTTAVAMLYDSGDLNLSTPLASPHLLGPTFAAGDAQKLNVTVHHCLTHSAGFAPDPEPNFWDPHFGCPNGTRGITAKMINGTTIGAATAVMANATTAAGEITEASSPLFPSLPAYPLPSPDYGLSCGARALGKLMNESLLSFPGTKMVYSDLSFLSLMYVVGRAALGGKHVNVSDFTEVCRGIDAVEREGRISGVALKMEGVKERDRSLQQEERLGNGIDRRVAKERTKDSAAFPPWHDTATWRVSPSDGPLLQCAFEAFVRRRIFAPVEEEAKRMFTRHDIEEKWFEHSTEEERGKDNRERGETFEQEFQRLEGRGRGTGFGFLVPARFQPWCAPTTVPQIEGLGNQSAGLVMQVVERSHSR